MLCQGYDKVLDLRAGDLVELRDARGSTLRVTRGTLWITQQDDSRDITLRAGDVWTVERHGLTLAEAQNDSTVCVAGDAGEVARSHGRRIPLREWIGAFFASFGPGSLERRRRLLPF